MTNVILLGLFLAFAAGIVYITRSWTKAENKNAANEGFSKAALDQLKALNEERMARERETRLHEQEDIDHATAGPGGGHPFLSEDKDPDSLN